MNRFNCLLNLCDKSDNESCSVHEWIGVSSINYPCQARSHTHPHLARSSRTHGSQSRHAIAIESPQPQPYPSPSVSPSLRLNKVQIPVTAAADAELRWLRWPREKLTFRCYLFGQGGQHVRTHLSYWASPLKERIWAARAGYSRAGSCRENMAQTMAQTFVTCPSERTPRSLGCIGWSVHFGRFSSVPQGTNRLNRKSVANICVFVIVRDC